MFESHIKHQEVSKLNIKIDPWDNYLYYDSKLILEMIFTPNCKFVEDMYILNQFLIWTSLNDITANLKGEGKVITKKLNEFLKTKSFYNELIESSRRIVYNSSELREEERITFDSYLEESFEEFIGILRDSNNFNDIKQDYFGN